MPKLKPAAFLSYVRLDDDHEDGKLSELRSKLTGELRLQTGEEFPIFQDRNDISWGENWRTRIERGLDATTLLICIITPSFFKSPSCRGELDKFLERERKSNRDDLILPIYYVECPEMTGKNSGKRDKLAKIMSSRQYVDWRDLRFEPLGSPSIGKVIAQMAEQIRGVLSRGGGTAKKASKVKKRSAPKRPRTVAAERTFMKATAGLASKSNVPSRIVDSSGAGQHLSIQEAIRAATPGERIIIRPGHYGESLVIDKPLEFIGDGPASAVIVSSKANTVVTWTASMGRITNLLIKHEGKKSKSPSCALKVNQGRPIIENCRIETSRGDGVILQGGASPRLNGNTIISQAGAAIGIMDAHALIERNELRSETLEFVVAVFGGSEVTIRQNTISGGLTGISVWDKSSISIDENLIFDSEGGISIGESKATISSNKIRGCGIGMELMNNAKVRVEDNVVQNTSDNGILIGKGCTVELTRNVVENSGGSAVQSGESKLVSLLGNDFETNNKNGGYIFQEPQ